MRTLGVIAVSVGVASLALSLWARAKSPTPASNFQVLSAVGLLIAVTSQFFVSPMELRASGSILGSCIGCYASYRLIKGKVVAGGPWVGR